MHSLENKDVLFIINPNSGSRKTERFINDLKETASDISFIITNNLNELADAFNTNIEKYKVFVVVGGDGSVNEVSKYLYNKSDKILAIFPAGSGNGFARELGFKKSITSLIRDIKRGESINIDVLSVNKKDCINVAGLGFDSYVAHCFAKSSGRGLKNYIRATIKSIFSFKAFHAELIIDNVPFSGIFQMLTIANTRQFGNNAIIVPQAKPNDGVFEIALVKPFPIYLYPLFVAKLFGGTLKNSKYIQYIEAKEKVEIKSEFKNYHVDGEPLIFSDKLTIEMLPQKVRVLKTSNCKIS